MEAPVHTCSSYCGKTISRNVIVGFPLGRPLINLGAYITYLHVVLKVNGMVFLLLFKVLVSAYRSLFHQFVINIHQIKNSK